MYQSCKYCGRVHQAGAVCAYKPKPKTRDDDTRSRKFRNTAAWRRKREEIQTRDHHMCIVCLHSGHITYDNTEVHHIEPLSERYDLRLADGNLITLCGKHHRQADSGEITRQALAVQVNSKVPPHPKDRGRVL